MASHLASSLLKQTFYTSEF